MRRLLSTTAILLLAAGPLAAQNTTEPAAEAQGGAQSASPDAVGILFIAAPDPEAIYGSDLIGMTVYSSDSDYEADYGSGQPVTAEMQSGWDSIGEVNDILITSAGDVQGVLVDIGGFLGLGEHTVALDMSRLHFLRDENQDMFLAVNSSQEELENAPAFQREDRTAAVGGDPTTGMMADDTADTGMMADDTANTGMMADTAAAPGMMGTRPAFEREGYTDADYAALTAEDLQGAAVYDGNDENVGSVEELVLAADGAIEEAVLDVGGFLGIGAHSVAIPFDEMQVMTNAGGDDVRVYIDQTREQLEQRPEYSGG
jgi:sporulation protein YlmC with PRC-barrel domain